MENFWSDIWKFVKSLFPSFGFGLFAVASILCIHFIFLHKKKGAGNEKVFSRQIVQVVVGLVGLIGVVILLPVSESLRNQLIGLIGLLLSGIIAFSSTNIIANLMGGILLRITKPFRTGDFIRVGDYFGRVTERGLFDTEIQTETRELVALPNTFLINNPVTTIRTSGTIVSASLSLGYDVSHSKIEPLLIEAARKCELQDPFVHIVELGNFSVTYRISGLLLEVKWLISARSELFRAVLDTLHEAGIEIMSPSFMNQRRVPDEKKIIPRRSAKIETNESTMAEEIVFDKADEAEERDASIIHLNEEIEQLRASLKEASAEEKDKLTARLDQAVAELKEIENPEKE
ncbi:MAG: mechanosensitive ion channel [Spirochaetales bacterium]|nr:mechanosensitive ion channel [Spirochaetales bacterium]